MGTNYYATPKVTDEQKRLIIKAVDENDFTAAKKMMPTKIHIGKSSYGWQFCFNHNNWEYFEKNMKSLKKFLNDCKIYDEYGEQIPSVHFWEMVLKKKNKKAILFSDEQECGTMEFGLNFSTSTDFS